MVQHSQQLHQTFYSDSAGQRPGLSVDQSFVCKNVSAGASIASIVLSSSGDCEGKSYMVSLFDLSGVKTKTNRRSQPIRGVDYLNKFWQISKHNLRRWLFQAIPGPWSEESSSQHELLVVSHQNNDISWHFPITGTSNLETRPLA